MLPVGCPLVDRDDARQRLEEERARLEGLRSSFADEHLSDEDILKEVLANNRRYKPEPHFSKTGVGSLSPTSTEERAKELEHSTELTRKVTERARKNGKQRKASVLG